MSANKYIPHLILIAILLALIFFRESFVGTEMSYWNFLTYKYVLNIGVATIGIISGYLIKNYYIVVGGATFALIIYCLAFLFETHGYITPFLLAIYTVFLAFATIANLVCHFKDWVLAK
jgi:hypothetical protein